MTLNIKKTYLSITILLFIIEVLIAVFLKTGFIRHTFGDYLVVILLFCFISSFIEINSFKLAIYVLAFAFLVEFLQLLNILEVLNLQNNHFLTLILGSIFQISDLVAYTLGIVTVIFFEYKIYKLWIT